MPYKTISDLPNSVRHALPDHAQEIYLEVFNSAWKKHLMEPLNQREETCHKIAWSAVKRNYVKQDNGLWTPK